MHNESMQGEKVGRVFHTEGAYGEKLFKVINKKTRLVLHMNKRLLVTS